MIEILIDIVESLTSTESNFGLDETITLKY